MLDKTIISRNHSLVDLQKTKRRDWILW